MLFRSTEFVSNRANQLKVGAVTLNSFLADPLCRLAFQINEKTHEHVVLNKKKKRNCNIWYVRVRSKLD